MASFSNMIILSHQLCILHSRVLYSDEYKLYLFVGTKVRILDPSVPVNGRVPRLINDIDEDSEGNLYWTDSSTLYNLSEGSLEFIAGPSGR